MGGEDTETLTAEIPSELMALVRADPRYNKDVVEAALWAEFGGHREAGLERRITEEERRLDMIDSEIAERKEEREQTKQRLESYQSKLDQKTDRKSAVYADAADVLSPDMLEPGNPAVINWAEKAGVDPEEFIDAMHDRLDP